MRRVGLLVLVAACGGEAPKAPAITTFAQAADAAVAGMREFGAILDGVEDVAGAEAAVPKLEALTKKLRAVVAAVDRMPEVDPGPEIARRVGAAFSALSSQTAAYVDRVVEIKEIGDVLAGEYGEVQDQIRTLSEMLGG